MDALPVGVLVVDGRGRLAAANRAALEGLGLDGTAPGREGFAALLADDALRAAVEAGGDGREQFDVHLSGKAFRAEAGPLPGGEEGARLVTLRDVTGMSKALGLRLNFISDVFHKIGTPLTTIMNVMSIATGGRVDPREVDLSEILLMGKGEVERLRGLLGRLRDLFLVEAGCLSEDIEIQRVGVAELLERAAREIQPRIGSRSQTLETSFPRPGVEVLADPDALLRALRCLLANANAYTQTLGTVLLSGEPDGDRLRIRVADDGPGIPEEDLPEVFRRFRRGSTAHVDSVDGEGLGLYLAQALVLAQGGTLHLDSRVGDGTTVDVYLPLAEEGA